MTEQAIQTVEAAPTLHARLLASLADAQAEMPEIPKEREADTGKYKYKYADISDVLSIVRPVLSRHGLIITQTTEINEQNIVLVTKIWHTDGASIESTYPVCAVNNNHQSMGGAMTYARRTALCALIGVAATEDLDGADAAKSGEGPTERMSANAAKDELNWDKIQEAIDNAPTLAHVEKMREKAKKRKDWPSSYVSAALERCDVRERVLTWRDTNAELFDDFDSAKSVDEIDRVAFYIKDTTEAQTDKLLEREVDDIAKKAKTQIVEDAKQ